MISSSKLKDGMPPSPASCSVLSGLRLNATTSWSPCRSLLAIFIPIYLYLSTNRGLQIINVSDLTNPQLMTPILSDQVVNKITLIDHYAYVSTWDDGLYVFDISVPTTPIEVGHYDLNINHMRRIGNYLYTTSRLNDGLSIIDISDPTKPVQVSSSILWFDYYSNQPDVITIKDNYILVVNSEGLHIFDVSPEPTKPVEIGFYPNLIAATNLVISKEYAYIAQGVNNNSQSYQGGFNVINVSNPTQPFQVSFPDLDRPSYPVYNVAIKDDYAYLA